MAVSYSFEKSFFILCGVDEYTTVDLKEKLEDAIADPQFPDDAMFILDVTASKSLSERSNPDVEDMAAFLSSRSDRYGNSCAIVAKRPLHYGLMRMGSAIAEFHGMRTAVFETLEEAKTWFEFE
ncbi:MAG: hypothetical protein GKR91_11625 [Pseudomonadales bacterium]|nr:hypothetical protein [Pseudomonadales bacterium]